MVIDKKGDNNNLVKWVIELVIIMESLQLAAYIVRKNAIKKIPFI